MFSFKIKEFLKYMNRNTSSLCWYDGLFI